MTRSIITLSNPINFSISPYVAVIYQIQSPINESNKVLHHGNATKNVDKAYIKTSKKVLEKTKKLLPEGWSSKTVYDKVNRDSGGTMYSTSQSNELRDTRQVYRQAAKLNENKESNPNESNDELESIVSYQKIHPEFIRSVTLLKRSYYIFFGDNIQLNDVAKFCCEMDDVLCIDTTFNLCSSWVTDTSYKNLGLLNHDGTFPIFLGPCIVHFEKYDFIFNRFASEMCSYQPMIRSLKTIGTDLEKAIYNGFSSQIEDLKLLLCVLHLEKRDHRKFLDLKVPPKAIKQILRDIYGTQYGGVNELGLADAIDSTDFWKKLSELKSIWEKLCPGFFHWFLKKRSQLFQNSVIASARNASNIYGLFYNNNVESNHFREKTEQAFKKKSVLGVLDTLKTLLMQQQEDEIKALYGSGLYRLSAPYKKFQKDSVVFHNMNTENRRKLVNQFRSYKPNFEDKFIKPVGSGRKPNETKRKRKPAPEIFIDLVPVEENVKVHNPNAEEPTVYELHLRSKVPRRVERRQRNSGKKLILSSNEDYLLVKSYGPTSYMHDGKIKPKYEPQYIHFNSRCLKEYALQKHEKTYSHDFPMNSIKVDDAALPLLNEEARTDLQSYGINL